MITWQEGTTNIINRGQNEYEVVGVTHRWIEVTEDNPLIWGGWPGQQDAEDLYHVVLLPRTKNSRVATVTESVLMGKERWKEVG